MSDCSFVFHYVCTHEEAKELITKHDRFWVSDCGCREKKESCGFSRKDICLIFRDDIGSSGKNMKPVSRAQVIDIILEAEHNNLVTRPYRNQDNPSVTDGICFCCKDCCDYFLNPDENKCDKGQTIEKTDMAKCSQCGDCVEVCYFNARKMIDDELNVNRDNCYGCGVCVDNCPEECIAMIPANAIASR